MVIFRLVFGGLLLAALLCFGMYIATQQRVWLQRGLIVVSAWARCSLRTTLPAQTHSDSSRLSPAWNTQGPSSSGVVAGSAAPPASGMQSSSTHSALRARRGSTLMIGLRSRARWA